MEEALFSVVVLCYRHFEYLEAAIKSVLDQDYGNIELIVSDDGSDGFPEEIIRQYIEKEQKDNISCVLIRQEQENVGTVRHLNYVRRCCHGAYVIFLAGDDVLDNPHVLTDYVAGFDHAPDNCMIEMAQTAMYDEHLDCLLEYYLKPPVMKAIQKTVENTDDLLRMLTIYGPCLPSTSTCFRGEFFEKFGDFDEKYLLVEDYPMHMRLAHEGWVIHYVNMVAIKHRHGGISHGQHQTAKSFSLKYYSDLHKALTELQIPAASQLKDEDERRHTLVSLKNQKKWIEMHIAISERKYRTIFKLAAMNPVDTLAKIIKKSGQFVGRYLKYFLFLYLALALTKPAVRAAFFLVLHVDILGLLDFLSWTSLTLWVISFVLWGAMLLLEKISRFPREVISV